MNKNEIIKKIIYPAFDEVKDLLDNPEEFKKDEQTLLIGSNSVIDSMGLVSLLVVMEEIILEEFDKSITIADEKAMSRENSPFKSVVTLSEYLEEILN